MRTNLRMSGIFAFPPWQPSAQLQQLATEVFHLQRVHEFFGI